jgi:hypothetical protein
VAKARADAAVSDVDEAEKRRTEAELGLISKGKLLQMERSSNSSYQIDCNTFASARSLIDPTRDPVQYQASQPSD